MPIQRVGHVVLKMRDLEAAKRFYCGVLGMTVVEEKAGRGMFLRFGDYHHDLAVFKVRPDAEAPRANQVGLAHVALVVDSFDSLQRLYREMVAAGVTIVSAMDHGITRSVYCLDPEGNQIELYCEVPEVRVEDIETMFTVKPLELDPPAPLPPALQKAAETSS